jgi:hypothetical protein
MSIFWLFYELLVPHLFGILFVLDPLNLQRCPAFVNFIFFIVCQRAFAHGAWAICCHNFISISCDALFCS